MSNPYPPDSYGSSSYDPYRQPAETYPQYTQSSDPYSQYRSSPSGNSYDPYPPQPYTPPVPQISPVYIQPVIVGQQSNGKATAALILGLLSIVCWFLTGIPAVILGHMALNEIRASNGTQSGSGSAITGLVFGYLSVGLLALCIFCYLIGGLASYTSYR